MQGDVTRLAELGIAGDYHLLVDLGWYHLVPAGWQDTYVRTVTWAAAPGATLLMLGMGRPLGVSEADLRRRFAAWEITPGARIRREAFWRRCRTDEFLPAGWSIPATRRTSKS
jgi:hypothetical protein